MRGAYPDLVISADTWRNEVGRAACAAGVDLLNDTWSGWDPKLAEVAAEFRVSLVCSHTGGLRPRTRVFRAAYADVMADVLDRTLNLARARYGPAPTRRASSSTPRTTSARTPGTRWTSPAVSRT